jgi:hypothetical protein
MEINIKVSIEMGSFTEKESIYGWTVHHIKANLLKAYGKVKAVGNLHQVKQTYILELIERIRKTDMEDIFGRMAVFTKDNSRMTWSNSCDI